MVTSLILLSMLQLAANPLHPGGTVTDTVDLIELNHLYDDLGRHQVDQVIFYQWSPDYRRFDVIAWHLIEDDLAKLPVNHIKNGWTSVLWRDREGRVQREVRSKNYRETWTRNDPERANKQVLEEKNRSSLRRAPDRPVVR